MQRSVSLFLLLASAANAGKFFDDDPLIAEPKPIPVEKIQNRKLSDYYDLFSNFFAKTGERQPKAGPPIPAQGVNTIGEPMEGAWWVRRHYYQPMSREALKQGASANLPPSAQGPWTVIGAKNEGITPGFVILDANKRRYFVKFDPLSNPEMATGADQIALKLFYALGYHVPDNYVVYFTRDMLALGEGVEVTDERGKTHKMTDRDVNEILLKVPQTKDRKYRATASLAVPGKGVGPYRYYGRRTDDPNDLVPHEHRRDLRGLHVFCAWTAHDDSRAINTFDSLTEEDGAKFVKHYILDVASALGSATSRENSPRSGGEYLFGWKLAAKNLLTLGLDVPFWAKADYPKMPSVGNFEADVFDPEKWVPEYPNPAFVNRLPDDEFWAAKQVMAFGNDEIAAIVETAEYSDPKAAAYVTECLAKRRDKIGRAYFAKVLPLDKFEIRNGELVFEDLGAKHNMPTGAPYQIDWKSFDNAAGTAVTQVAGAGSRLPSGAGYWMAEVSSPARKTQKVRVYVRNTSAPKLVGIERTW